VRPNKPLVGLSVPRLTACVKRSPFLLPWFLLGVFAEQPVTASIPATAPIAIKRLKVIVCFLPIYQRKNRKQRNSILPAIIFCAEEKLKYCATFGMGRNFYNVEKT
jgi:hypothetical protein